MSQNPRPLVLGLLEIVQVEPRLGQHGLGQAVLPQPGNINIELPLQLLIDSLNAIASDSPLTAQPKNVAMQGHSRLPISNAAYIQRVGSQSVRCLLKLQRRPRRRFLE